MLEPNLILKVIVEVTPIVALSTGLFSLRVRPSFALGLGFF